MRGKKKKKLAEEISVMRKIQCDKWNAMLFIILVIHFLCVIVSYFPVAETRYIVHFPEFLIKTKTFLLIWFNFLSNFRPTQSQHVFMRHRLFGWSFASSVMLGKRYFQNDLRHGNSFQLDALQNTRANDWKSDSHGVRPIKNDDWI